MGLDCFVASRAEYFCVNRSAIEREPKLWLRVLDRTFGFVVGYKQVPFFFFGVLVETMWPS